VTLDDGEVIDAVPVNVSQVGERTQVSIRPERVEYNPSACQGAHTIKAEVLEFIYMGDIYRTRLRWRATTTISSSRRATRPTSVRLKPGEQIEIGWRPQDCRALDA
jgi:putative spermidine/putrescine transport system ATP-binding protein